MRNILLSGKDVCKSFFQNGTETRILDHITVDIYDGDFTVIMGASGAGKSTLLHALSGMDGITGGEITFQGRKLDSLSENKMTELRAKKFGFIFQQTHLVSNLTLFENVAVAGYAGRMEKGKTVRERAMRLLVQMHTDHAKDRLPSQVSGGEAQRAAIARAMMNNPGLIFADEPTGALNQASGREVLNLLSGLNKNGQGILMVTHDIRAALRGNRLLYLEDGRISGELVLSHYEEGDGKARESKINDWLSSLQW